ncbi:GNAT family N-acetyltransferase [Spiroplasma taiwanense]|uniref:N-acetyltransferase domain-containing protein n=1 Tax=Spiroplasma taiwanense CT-1 TaxID=1276220 RepID=S5MB27_9MOLU|nr:GNAT family N-acetyltransferase [Spiroplasma taiwanense]AGR40978.1 hypothetical protein STAIW_v1c03200 [Spiroplasma taiwanense CT-1]
MKKRISSRVIENKKFNIAATVYLNYYVDPLHKTIEEQSFENFIFLKFFTYPSIIALTNWNKKFKNECISKINLYKPNFLINFATSINNDFKLPQLIRFKVRYKFMALNLKQLKKFVIDEKPSLDILEVNDEENLNEFVKVISDTTTLQVSDKEKFFGMFELNKEEKINYLLLAKYNSEYSGVGHLIYYNEKIGMIDDISVKEDFRNNGIATIIMKSLINKAIDDGLDELYLFASEQAIEIYKKLGFIEDDFWLEQYNIL